MRRLAPRPIAVALEELRDQWEPETVLAAVQRAWPQVVGPQIAAAAQPIAERRGVLTVACSAAVWAQELDLMAPEIIVRLNQALAQAPIERLRCVALEAD